MSHSKISMTFSNVVFIHRCIVLQLASADWLSSRPNFNSRHIPVDWFNYIIINLMSLVTINFVEMIVIIEAEYPQELSAGWRRGFFSLRKQSNRIDAQQHYEKSRSGCEDQKKGNEE